MQWFKHYSNFSSRPSVQRLLSKHRANGHFVLMQIFELMAQSLSPDMPDEYRFDFLFFKRECFFLIHPKTGIAILKTLQELGFLEYKISDGYIRMECSLMAKWAGRYCQQKIKRIARERKEKYELDIPDDFKKNFQ